MGDARRGSSGRRHVLPGERGAHRHRHSAPDGRAIAALGISGSPQPSPCGEAPGGRRRFDCCARTPVRARAWARNVARRRTRAQGTSVMICAVYGTTGELIKLWPVLRGIEERGGHFVNATTAQQVTQIPGLLTQLGLQQPDVYIARGRAGRELHTNRDIPPWIAGRQRLCDQPQSTAPVDALRRSTTARACARRHDDDAARDVDRPRPRCACRARRSGRANVGPPAPVPRGAQSSTREQDRADPLRAGRRRCCEHHAGSSSTPA